MPVYKLRGIDVDFPFEAYDCQLVYMEKVIQSLQERCNALLESPTGTGKTLCLLCATLAWRKSLGGFSTGRNEWNGPNTGSQHSDVPLSQSAKTNLPTIIYASRTHSQLRQVIQELKRTSYRPKMVVLGSREQLCIHEEVSLLRGRAQTNACHLLCRKRTKKGYCGHYSRVSDFMKYNPGLGDEPIDIEDLVNIGRGNGPCPYYVSRELHKVVDILFAPYNYLIDRGYRKSLSIGWNNSILIFDEAHNLEGLCSDAASFDLPSWLLTACISEAKNCVDLSISRREIEKANDKSCNPDNFAILRALLLKLEKRIAEVPIESKELGFTRPGPYIYELLADLNITHKTATMLIDIIEEAALLLEEDAKGAAQKTTSTICRLETMSDILKIIFRDGGNAHAKFYRVHVQEVESNTADALKDTVPTDRIVVLQGGWGLFRRGSSGQILLRLTYKAYVEDEEDDKTDGKSMDTDVSDDEMSDSEDVDATFEQRQRGTLNGADKESFMDLLAALIVSEEFQGIVASETGSMQPSEAVPSLDPMLRSRGVTSSPNSDSEISGGSALLWLSVLTSTAVLIALSMGSSGLFNP